MQTCTWFQTTMEDISTINSKKAMLLAIFFLMAISYSHLRGPRKMICVARVYRWNAEVVPQNGKDMRQTSSLAMKPCKISCFFATIRAANTRRPQRAILL